MSRGITDAELAWLQSNRRRFKHLVKIEWAAGTSYWTTAPIDITYLSNTYESAGGIMEIGDLVENVVPTVQSTTIKLTGILSDNISLILNNSFIDVPVTITAVLLDKTNTVQVALPFKYVGERPSCSDDLDAGTSDVILNITSHWSTFDKVAGRYCNNNDQTARYSGDTFFKFADQPLRNIRWGQA